MSSKRNKNNLLHRDISIANVYIIIPLSGFCEWPCHAQWHIKDAKHVSKSLENITMKIDTPPCWKCNPQHQSGGHVLKEKPSQLCRTRTSRLPMSAFATSYCSFHDLYSCSPTSRWAMHNVRRPDFAYPSKIRSPTLEQLRKIRNSASPFNILEWLDSTFESYWLLEPVWSENQSLTTKPLIRKKSAPLISAKTQKRSFAILLVFVAHQRNSGPRSFLSWKNASPVYKSKFNNYSRLANVTFHMLNLYSKETSIQKVQESTEATKHI